MSEKTVWFIHETSRQEAERERPAEAAQSTALRGMRCTARLPVILAWDVARSMLEQLESGVDEVEVELNGDMVEAEPYEAQPGDVEHCPSCGGCLRWTAGEPGPRCIVCGAACRVGGAT